jgi:hypothetical protein
VGHGVTSSCKICNHAEEFILGVGMMYSSLENVLDTVVHWRYRTKISEILIQHKLATTEYSHELYICPACEIIFERFYIKISQFDKVLYESSFCCNKCKCILNKTSPEFVDRSRCKKCHARELYWSSGLLWD